jgi:hypothetical protein
MEMSLLTQSKMECQTHPTWRVVHKNPVMLLAVRQDDKGKWKSQRRLYYPGSPSMDGYF